MRWAEVMGYTVKHIIQDPINPFLAQKGSILIIWTPIFSSTFKKIQLNKSKNI
jgi:hypothetical protein